MLAGQYLTIHLEGDADDLAGGCGEVEGGWEGVRGVVGSWSVRRDESDEKKLLRGEEGAAGREVRHGEARACEGRRGGYLTWNGGLRPPR